MSGTTRTTRSRGPALDVPAVLERRRQSRGGSRAAEAAADAVEHAAEALFDRVPVLNALRSYLVDAGYDCEWRSRDLELPLISALKRHLVSEEGVLTAEQFKSLKPELPDLVADILSSIPSQQKPQTEEELHAACVTDAMAAAEEFAAGLARGDFLEPLGPSSKPSHKKKTHRKRPAVSEVSDSEVSDSEEEEEVMEPGPSVQKKVQRKKKRSRPSLAAVSAAAVVPTSARVSVEMKRRFVSEPGSLDAHLASFGIDLETVGAEDRRVALEILGKELDAFDLRKSLDSTYGLDVASKRAEVERLERSLESDVESEFNAAKAKKESVLATVKSNLLLSDMFDASTVADMERRVASLESELADGSSWLVTTKTDIRSVLESKIAAARASLESMTASKAQYDVFREVYSGQTSVVEKQVARKPGSVTNKKKKKSGPGGGVSHPMSCAPVAPAAPTALTAAQKAALKVAADAIDPVATKCGYCNARMIECRCQFCNSGQCDHGKESSPNVFMRVCYLKEDGTPGETFVWDAYSSRVDVCGPPLLGVNDDFSIRRPDNRGRYRAYAAKVFLDAFGPDGLNSMYGHDQSLPDELAEAGGLSSKSAKVRKASKKHLVAAGKDEGYPFHFYVFHHVEMTSPDNHTLVLIPQKYYAGPEMLCDVFGPEMKHQGVVFGNTDRANKTQCKLIFGKYGWYDDAPYRLVDTPMGGIYKGSKTKEMEPRAIYPTLWFKDVNYKARMKKVHAIKKIEELLDVTAGQVAAMKMMKLKEVEALLEKVEADEAVDIPEKDVEMSDGGGVGGDDTAEDDDSAGEEEEEEEEEEE
jgi:hypothetical protein